MTYRVVIADDDSDIRSLVEISVRRAGLEPVAVVEDGDAALASILREQPDLAILDIAMPGLDGFQVCQAVRSAALPADVRIVLLSASVDDTDRTRSLEAGADYFMPKPFSPQELVAWLAVGKQAR
ncbi:two-component system OmpR family response regulator [Microbacteriaceae bacterium SG_E_30_P1]|uniref:Two-component system OmpR family response regulator n=1 Tax=Antiquaquibacter oligotrophicus TaxID=2880260 RepID=A0ABT6KPL7_9MICO|nr:response regulator transcription factor [Antiquaquibacter oligotrophicus]MDH6181942.1 two-component system OmpR family response regulator [Antiquaquibacter oligotrophicus]UDF12388.1 response regulator transcription factor [Antiquaquibacter oligotrophicus]